MTPEDKELLEAGTESSSSGRGLSVAWGNRPAGSQFSLCQLGSFRAAIMYKMRIKT